MKTYCLVIDDDIQKDYFETDIQKVLHKDHIDLIPIYIETKDRTYMKRDHTGFDKSLIEQACLNAIKEYNCSIVVSDYQIATDYDDFNGLDILNDIAEKFPHLYLVLYSGAQIENAIKKVIKALSDTIPKNQGRMSEQQITDAINQLRKTLCINELIKGKGYAEAVIKYIRSSSLPLQQKFLSQLKDEYPDMKFMSCYPPLTGWKLKDIGEQIEKQTPQGCDFQQALIEQTISYMVDINKE
mgnify:CR=1 FL=1